MLFRADPVGLSLARRLMQAFGFMGAALAGGRGEPIDLPLKPVEQAVLHLGIGHGSGHMRCVLLKSIV